MTRAACAAALVAFLAGPAAAAASESCVAPSGQELLPADMVAAARQPHAFPTFCSIPPIPGDVRTASQYKTAVVDTRLAGRQLTRESDESTFSLTGTDDFAAGARIEAVPPPPMDNPDGDTDAFINAAKSRANPPPRPH